MSNDPYDLARFIQAQEGLYDQALAEIKSGRKRSHWMWFIFPQIAGLGFSAMSQRYAIQRRDEAAAYLEHPVLGPRLIEISEALLNVSDRTAYEIFGPPDDMKLCSCATLFAQISRPGSVFERILKQYFGGEADDNTLKHLEKS